jgi:diguanylate cyclase (GGDEF)-like protein
MNNTAKDDERLRLETLHAYDVLDTPPEARFDRITRLARTILRVPIAQISFVDTKRQWFKSGENLIITETPREDSFCTHTIKSDCALIVPDARADPRFRGLPRVVGEPFIRSYIGAPLCAPNGQRIGALYVVDTKVRRPSAVEVGILQDLAQLVMDELELRLVATTDSLTGVLSRRAFFEAAGRDFARAFRHDEALSCVLFDVDHFKRINDLHGHAAGDQALQQVTKLIKDNLRMEDYLGRIGGEEFALLMPMTARANALDVGDRLRQRVMESEFAVAGGAINLTVSAGVAELHPDDRSFKDMLGRADGALYAAKMGGRNRSVCHQGLPQPVS